MFHKVKNVTALQDFILEIIFEDNSIKYYDVKPLFNKWIIFKSLKDISGLFEQVKIDIGGYGISWNDEIDLSCNELYTNSYEK
mgnify:CR=1 FL=1